LVIANTAAQPSFLVTPQDQVVTVGRRVVMRCQVTGNPVPAVFWNKQSSQVGLHNVPVNPLTPTVAKKAKKASCARLG